MTRADLIKAEREQLLIQRGEMKKEIEQQKREMYEQIEKVKQGKLNPSEILQTLSIQKGSDNISRSPSKPNKSVQVVTKAQDSKLPSKNTTLDQTKPLDKEKTTEKPTLKKKTDD